jgi:outer membrane protein TolC
MHQLLLSAVLLAAASDTTTNARTAPLPAVSRGVADSAARPAPRMLPVMPPHGEIAFASTDTLALDWLEREALRRNPGFAAMRAAAAGARAKARLEGSLEDPMVEFAFAPRSYTEPHSGGGMGVDAAGHPITVAPEEIPAYKWSIRQRLPLFGERGLARRSARAEAAASLLDAEAARLDLLEEVRLAFFQLYRAERALETNAQQAVLVNQFRRVALARYASGTEGQQDPLMADTELGMLAHSEAVLQRDRRVARMRLNTLLNRHPSLALPPPPVRIQLPPLADTSRAGLAARSPWPELRASDARIAAEEARLSLAGRGRLPQFEIGFERDFFMDEWERRSVVMVGMNLPIGLGRNAARRDEARASLQRARAERVATADRVALKLEEARVDYEEVLHEIEVLETILVPTSERSLAGARSGYESGRGGFLPLIEAARRRAEVRLMLEEARARAAQAWAMLQRAVAGDVLVLTPETADGGKTGSAATSGSNRKESQR